MMSILIYVVSFLFGMASLMIAFCYVVHSGKVVKGALIGWGLLIIFTILVSLVFPAMVGIYYPEYCRYFPDAIAIPAVIYWGWMHTLGVAIIAVIIRQLMKRWGRRKGSGF